MAPRGRFGGCVGCGACAAICPQKIDIPAAMRDLAEKLSAMPAVEIKLTSLEMT